MIQVESLKNLRTEANKAWHEARLNWAIYWGRIPWAMRETRALKFDQRKGMEKAAEAFFNAAKRAEIIYGDYDKAHILQAAGFELLKRAHRKPEATI
jgi:hypothetical protein